MNLQWTNESCIGGERSLLSTGVWITITVSGGMSPRGKDVRPTRRQMIEYNSSLYIPDLDSYFENYSYVLNTTFEFEQPEHGGGLCHCVRINFTHEAKIFK